ncbi:hypothetical protein BP5796_08144 [Coleophoma crateriformis]|uniref:tRNA wybutosine-synthesizing protein 2 n=1 Tax=Coleophoma crateriformis TaxID=565419 RepID=A0A3D8RDQ9_9HELO|nr:hypothetical protein BP5796_08144 [Coleophoma crateriformis]
MEETLTLTKPPNQPKKDKSQRPPKPKPVSPILEALQRWQDTLPEPLLATILASIPNLIHTAPRRWVVYPPMLLLPSGSFSSLISTAGDHAQLENSLPALWLTILETVSKREGKGNLTHLAINSGIPLHAASSEANQVQHEHGQENVMRTPSGLMMLHGDFGPPLSPTQTPSLQDLENAFWVSTKQNGLVQMWAPRYTMFSRGNIKEKARLLDFHESVELECEKGAGESNGKRKHISRTVLGQHRAVDLYAGIGYFVFSYVKMGMGKVRGWEVNPWSVEGLRRGAIANGFSVRVITPDRTDEVAFLKDGPEDIVIFLQDNKMALRTLQASPEGGSVLHVNCGLLPTSEPVWRDAFEMAGEEAWLHLHDNVGINDIEMRRSEIEMLYRSWLTGTGSVEVGVNLVKTFAPGVWHCVFDVYIKRSNM